MRTAFLNSWQSPHYPPPPPPPPTPRHPASTPPLNRSPLTSLPTELAHQISSYLSPRSLLSLMLTSKHRNAIHASTLGALRGYYTIPAVLTRIMGYYTHRNYGERLVANLAPPHPNAAELPVPTALRELWAWHDGYLDAGDWYLPIMMLPNYMSLCSYEESMSSHTYWQIDSLNKEEVHKEEGLEFWAVFEGPPPIGLFIVVDSTGRAAWIDEDNIGLPWYPEKDAVWFTGLYELLAALEKALEEGRLSVRETNGVPLAISPVPGGGSLEPDSDTSEPDSDDEPLIDGEVCDEFKEGRFC